MSITTIDELAAAVPRVRRVRHQARETVALMAFSAVASSGAAVLLLLVVSLGR
ncbi:hypothetical protein [Nocardioides bigeumensis]|uniref:Uncharacterized protein n=1 Tax=Nocardioides bigeumensis TaxID=433657 RepID=A0ABN2XVN1_9ACTN